MRRNVNAAWLWWKAFAHRVGSVQVRLVLGMLYFTVIVPFALILRFTSKPFRAAGWQPHEQRADTEALRARRQS